MLKNYNFKTIIIISFLFFNTIKINTANLVDNQEKKESNKVLSIDSLLKFPKDFVINHPKEFFEIVSICTEFISKNNIRHNSLAFRRRELSEESRMIDSIANCICQIAKLNDREINNILIKNCDDYYFFKILIRDLESPTKGNLSLRFSGLKDCLNHFKLINHDIYELFVQHDKNTKNSFLIQRSRSRL